MSDSRIKAVLAAFLILILGIVFLCLPSGWNIIPLALIGIVIANLSVLLQRHPSASQPAPSGSTDKDSASTEEAHGEWEHPSSRSTETLRRLNHAFGPIAAGMIIDLVDLATFGPIGIILGLPIGGLAGYWMARALGLEKKTALWCALAAGIYSTIPGTEIIPLATLLGAYVRFRKSS